MRDKEATKQAYMNRVSGDVRRLRSINAELVAALHDLVTLDQHEREAKATSYANGSPAWKAWEKARAALERAKQ